MIDPRVGILVAGCALFGGIVISELLTAVETNPSMFAATPRASNNFAIAQRPPPADLAAANLARPLFSPTRRPPDVASSSPSDPELTDKRLAGIVLEPDRRLAIFAVNGAKPLTVTEGDNVNGWRIETITAEQISLRGPGGTRTLRTKMDTSPVVPRPQLPARPQAPARSAPPDAATAQTPVAVPPNLNVGAQLRRNRE